MAKANNNDLVARRNRKNRMTKEEVRKGSQEGGEAEEP